MIKIDTIWYNIVWGHNVLIDVTISVHVWYSYYTLPSLNISSFIIIGRVMRRRMLITGRIFLGTTTGASSGFPLGTSVESSSKVSVNASKKFASTVPALVRHLQTDAVLVLRNHSTNLK